MFWVKWAVALLEFAARRSERELRAGRLYDDVALAVKVLRRAIRQAEQPVSLALAEDGRTVEQALAGLWAALDAPAPW